jgi:predicted nucleic acid-binding Zn ribbon protein
MIYTYKCPTCLTEKTESVSIEGRDTILIQCSACNMRMERVFNLGKVNVSMRGWGWTGQDYKEKRKREQHSVDMAIKQNDRYGSGSKLVPNYNGKEADSWEQIRDEAVFKSGAQVAPQYDTLIREERKGRKSTQEVVDKTIRDIKGM